ncbi:MAG: class I SAM-dependent methyltransferase [Sulfitobacter sp.]
MKSIPMMVQQIGSWEVLINRRPRTPQELTSRYDALSESWGRITRRLQLETAYRKPLKASGISAMLDHHGPDAWVLDCGIGNGSLSIALNSILPRSAQFHGIDMSAKMLVSAGALLQEAGIQPHLKQANVLSLPYDDQSFDVVMAAHILEHLSDPQLALSEMFRVLKPGGMIFVCMTRPSFFGALIQLRWRTWAISEDQGITWLLNCNLTEIDLQPVHLGSCAGHASTAFWARRHGQESIL